MEHSSTVSLFFKVKYALPNKALHFSGTQQRQTKIKPTQNWHMNVHSGLALYAGAKIRKWSKCPLIGWMDEQTVVYSYSGILLSNFFKKAK